MEIIPAIDISGGKCIRLYQGDYSQRTVFPHDPVAVALKWKSLGARWLHIIDLDGADAGEPRNAAIIEEIVNTSGLFVQVGGGIRNEETVKELLDRGIKRVILGTAAVENIELVQSLCQQFGEAIVVSLDVREGKIATHAWRKNSAMDALELGRRMIECGLRRFIYTDIKRDGTLSEPNFDSVRELVSQLSVPVIASGGISKLEHLRRLKKIGVEGAIIGKALYTGDIDLREAINVEV
jgi:phosphoribosylformimino-5-aminoimidazole carboxamide ribotide isomerase